MTNIEPGNEVNVIKTDITNETGSENKVASKDLSKNHVLENSDLS